MKTKNNSLKNGMKWAMIVGIMLTAPRSVWAQPGFEFNNRHLSQSNQINPAFMPQYGFSLGFNNATNIYLPNCKLSDVFDTTSNAETSIRNFIHNPNKQLAAQLQQDLGLFNLAFRNKKTYFSYGLNVHAEGDLRAPKDAIGLAMFGNAEYMGSTAKIDFSGIRFNSYVENKFSIGRQVSNKLSVGFTYSAINGIADFNIKKAYLNLTTDTNITSYYQMRFDAGADIQYSLMGASLQKMLDDTSGSYDPMKDISANLAFGTKNNQGSAMGFGAVYRMNEKLRLSFTANNFGSITWNTGAEQFKMNDASYTFKGLDTAMFDSINNIGKILMDTIKNTFQYASSSIGSYTQTLHPHYVLGVEYFLNPRTYFQIVGGTGYGINGDKSFATINAHKEIGEFIDVRAGYTCFDFNNPSHNVSAGVSLNLGPIQPWININSASIVAPIDNVRFYQVRMGLNINIGMRKDTDGDGVKDRKDSCYKTFGAMSNHGCELGYLGPAMKYDGSDDIVDSTMLLYIDTTGGDMPKRKKQTTTIVEETVIDEVAAEGTSEAAAAPEAAAVPVPAAPAAPATKTAPVPTPKPVTPATPSSPAPSAPATPAKPSAAKSSPETAPQVETPTPTPSIEAPAKEETPTAVETSNALEKSAPNTETSATTESPAPAKNKSKKSKKQAPKSSDLQDAMGF